MQTFGEWLDAQLTDRGWTAADLTRASRTSEHPRGFDSGLISRWRRPPPLGAVPGVRTLDQLATVFGVSRAEVYAAAGRIAPPTEDLTADTAASERGETQLSARQQSFQEQRERWVSVFGPRMGVEAAEDYFWEFVKHNTDTVLDAFVLGTAVNQADSTAVNGAVSATSKAGGRRRRGGRGELGARYPQLNNPLATTHGVANGALAA